jgi:hypothetical protein
MSTEEKYILNLISKEIEQKYECKVVRISFAQLLSLCVSFKVVFNDDFLYKPFPGLPTPETICFSKKSATFFKRVDLFECMKNIAKNN